MMKWTQERLDGAVAADLAKRYRIDPILSTILAQRGITAPEQLRFYLSPELALLHNPFLFEDMETFCERIQEAIESKEKVRIFGDRDVDGITSTVLMKTELERLGLDCSYALPENDEPYGLTMEGVKAAKDAGASLLITVDCGISSIEEIKYAASLGMDTLVCDHHLSGEAMPPARCMINPKAEGCGYPFPHLAACGVVAKCIWALRLSMTELYNEPIILLHLVQKNDVIVIEAAKLENLALIDRIVEEVVPGVMKASDSRALGFIGASAPVVVLDADYEKDMLRKAFGKSIEINLIDLRPEFEKYMPIVENATLFSLSLKSKASRFAKVKSELDTLISMFSAYARFKYPQLGDGYADILDLVAIGTISDLMPLEDENRVLVRIGLEKLEKGTRASMQPFMLKLGLAGKRLASTDIGWQIAPCINASGRLGNPRIACEMLLADSQPAAEDGANRLIMLNKERKRLSEDVWDRLLPKAKHSYELFGTKLVVLQEDSVPRGIAGVMANRLMKQFNAPSIVITATTEGVHSGSMRSFGDINTRDFLMKYSDLFMDFGGHKYAGGFSIQDGNLGELLARISEDADYMDCPEQEDETIIVDAVVPPERLTPDLIKTVELFEPYGEKNPPLVFLARSARIEQAQILRAQKGPSGHLRLTISHGEYQWPAVYWHSAVKLDDEFSEGDIVDVAFHLGKNSFRNQESLQLTVIGINRVRP